MAIALPGFANVHSHAFQRLLRGSVQRRDPQREDSFWTWRERMYALATSLDLDGIEAAARLCYAECLEAGYTAVGEFHYLHNREDGSPYPEWLATTYAHARAARQVGIRLSLLWTVYARGGFDAPLQPEQRRFGVPDLDTAKLALDALMPLADTGAVRVGLALHSVRAVPRDWLGPLAEEARRRGLPIHAHVSEQPREVAECRRHYGLSPVQLLRAEGVLGPDFTAVHATWLDDDDIEALARSRATVCLCPTTEGDLGDGIPPTAELHAAGIPLAIGSDSHAVIDPFAELRTAEYDARARTGCRCVLTDGSGDVGPALARIAHANGYDALGLPDGGDRVFLRDDARVFERVRDLLPVALLAGHPGLVERVDVAGQTVVEGGRHVLR
ncbi:MAG: formimidoylglutamate deiminase [Deltaproteobacteria bacterium]|nr:MAG: formimidoylglutamate deiminase [Deltaproteobacteria bacterium]